jgi:hypothetical protein
MSDEVKKKFEEELSKASNSVLQNDWEDLEFFYRAGHSSRDKEVKRLRDALTAWVSWEDEQIRKDGPYVGKKINELIERARLALKE